MKRSASVFLILLVFIFSSCDKESAGNPNLHGSWESTTTDLTLTFRDGRFEAVHDYLPSNSGYLIYRGSYTLDGSNIYLTPEQAEAFDHVHMSVPIIVVYQNTVSQHFKFKIRGETVEMTKADEVVEEMVIPNGIYSKKY
jgi:hypothetical protein